MSSFKKVVKRKTHKERPQPLSRTRFGLLEKHKDYVQRAKDFHSKEDRLRKLAEKATTRNPEEFYHKMINNTTKNGVHVASTGKMYSEKQIRALKHQDYTYLLSKGVSEQKKIDRLKTGLQLLEDMPTGEEDEVFDEEEDAGESPASLDYSHTVFVDSAGDMDTFDPQTHFNTTSDGLKHRHVIPRLDIMETVPPLGLHTSEDIERLARAKSRTYTELAERLDKQEAINKALRTITLERQLMGKGRKVKVSGEGEPPAYRWKTQRKK